MITFDEWWKQMKPAECDEVKPYFEEAWEKSAAAEREACADACEGQTEGFAATSTWDEAALSCARAIRMRSNA